MKKNIYKLLSVVALMTLIFGLSFGTSFNTYADDEGESETPIGTSISLTPVSKILQIASNGTYDETFTVTNDGDAAIRVEVYAAPYSYVYSDEEDLYKLGFTNENNYTQITRWISFKDSNGSYVEKPTFSIEPHESIDISLRIATPDNIPSGGQYAVVFAHTLSESISGSGIRTEASPGMVIYGRSTEGESIISAEISDLKISEEEGNIVATAKVKNNGNVDFNARGVLSVEPIIGFSSYTTPENTGRISVIPETELILSNAWEDSPSFGIYKATFTATVGDEIKTTERILFRIPLFVIVIIIILLTILIIWIILMVRRRKERRSRLAI